MSTFLDRLKQAMKESGATKTDLWKACEISSGAVSQWFSKPTTQLKGKNLLCVARVLNVNPEWLATGEGNKEPEDLQKHVMELMNNLSDEDLKSWLKYAEAMASKKYHAENAVDDKQDNQIKSEPIPGRKTVSRFPNYPYKSNSDISKKRKKE